MSDSACVIAQTTLPAGWDAEGFGRALVEERLAACVSVQGPVRSVYRWQGSIESEAEQLVLIKTTAARVESLRRRLLALHPYDRPEFLVLPVVAGDPEYLAWVMDSTVTESTAMESTVLESTQVESTAAESTPAGPPAAESTTTR